MKIPNKLKIGGHTYRVILTDDPNLLSNDALASIDTSHAVIYIEKGADPTIQASSLIHEIFHALNSTFGDNDMGHALIDSLSEQFYQVLSENRLLR